MATIGIGLIHNIAMEWNRSKFLSLLLIKMDNISTILNYSFDIVTKIVMSAHHTKVSRITNKYDSFMDIVSSTFSICNPIFSFFTASIHCFIDTSRDDNTISLLLIELASPLLHHNHSMIVDAGCAGESLQTHEPDTSHEDETSQTMKNQKVSQLSPHDINDNFRNHGSTTANITVYSIVHAMYVFEQLFSSFVYLVHIVCIIHQNRDLKNASLCSNHIINYSCGIVMSKILIKCVQININCIKTIAVMFQITFYLFFYIILRRIAVESCNNVIFGFLSADVCRSDSKDDYVINVAILLGLTYAFSCHTANSFIQLIFTTMWMYFKPLYWMNCDTIHQIVMEMDIHGTFNGMTSAVNSLIQISLLILFIDVLTIIFGRFECGYCSTNIIIAISTTYKIRVEVLVVIVRLLVFVIYLIKQAIDESSLHVTLSIKSGLVSSLAKQLSIEAAYCDTQAIHRVCGVF